MKAGPLFTADERGGRKARSAARAEMTSDVTRVREMAVAALAAAGVVALVVALTPGARSPGPLGRPHVEAGLACTACHGGQSAEKVCASCHGAAAHASTRPAHRALVATGELQCVTCHPAHGVSQGVTFTADDTFVRWGGGREIVQNGVHGVPGATVPLVAAGVCTRCHDATSAKDPIAACLLPSDGVPIVGHRPTVCFDEHVRVGDERAVRSRDARAVCSRQHGTGRFVAWEAAREVARRVPWLDGDGAPVWRWAFAGLAAALVGVGFERSLRRLARVRGGKALPQTPLVAATRVRLPQINTATCLGCYACVDACPFDVLEIQRYVAVVARPSDCTGVVLCQQACPNGSLQITEGEPIETRPRVDEHLESLDAPGVFLAGELTGLPLIKNAIRQGARAVDRIKKTLPSKRNGVDLAIIGAGPAGLAASLRAAELGLSYVTLEQGSIASSIQSFPRNKIVFDQPLQLPVEGDLWLRESTKEELLAHWARIVRARKLEIRERHRVTDIRREGEGFVVRCTKEDGESATVTAARLLLCIGRRGSPRKLDARIAPDAEGRVSYALADARSFEGKRVLIVGLGDSAMESAMAIARQSGTTVTLSYRGDAFARGRPRNIAEVKALAERGQIRLMWRSRVTAVDRSGVTLDVAGKPETIAADAVLVLIGGVPSMDLIVRAGVQLGLTANPDLSNDRREVATS